MKHIKLFEQFINESAVVGSFEIKVGSILQLKDEETWKVTKFIGKPTNPRGVFAIPYGKTKDNYVSVAIEFKMDELEKSIESIDEAVINESTRIPTMLYPSEFREYFSMRYNDLKQVYDRDIEPRIVQADNGKWYEISATYNRYNDRVVKVKSAKAPK